MHQKIKKRILAGLLRSSACILLFASLALQVDGQNLNNPNRTGPLGTQVNSLTGNLFIPRTDIHIPARMFDIHIGFNYNSYNYQENKGFGRGWNFSYDIHYSKDTAGNMLLEWGDGRIDKYDSVSPTAFKAPRGFFNVLRQYQPGKFQLTEKDSTVYYFDNAAIRKVTRMSEPNGNFIAFNYQDSLLTSLVNNAGQSISFEYDTRGRLKKVVDAIANPARSYEYTYDLNDNLVQVADPLGGKNAYTYLTNGPMKTIADKNNNLVNIIYFPNYAVSEIIGCNKRISFSFDTVQKKTTVVDYFPGASNQVTEYTYERFENLSWVKSVKGNCCGFNMSYEYDDQGNMTKEIDANGNTKTFSYDNKGNTLTATDELGNTCYYTYATDQNRILTYTDFKGLRYNLSYDNAGNLIKLVSPGSSIYEASYDQYGKIIYSKDPLGNVYTYNYDVFGNPSTVNGPKGYHADLSFDARGNLLSYTDARGSKNSGEYDILNRLKKVTDPINNVTRLSYDAQGNIVSVSNKNNEVTAINYDASNRPVQYTNPLGNKTKLSYDAMDKLTAVTNAANQTNLLQHNSLSRLTRMQDAQGNYSNIDYDANGNVIVLRLPNGQTINYTYDKKNRIIQTRDDNGTIANLIYDANGNITSFENGTGAIITATYDSLNRVTSFTDALGNRSKYAHNKNGKITSIEDRNGITSFYTYDSMSRVTSYRDNSGSIVTSSYDAQGNITQLKDQKNNITNYTYDSLNRRKTMTHADGTYRQYFYDKKGNLSSVRLEDASILSYQYDAQNRMTTKTLAGGDVCHYTYDNIGRVLTATNNAGTISFGYDILNRVISESFNGRSTRYTHSTQGRSEKVIYPDNTEIKKEFDTRGRLSKMYRNDTLLVEYAYNNANQMVSKTLENGISTQMRYDFANRLVNITTGGGTVQNTSFTFDKMRNKTSITRVNNPARSEEFTYDNNYRLIGYKRGTGTGSVQNTFTYDAVGNRIAASINGSIKNYTLNNLNQSTAVNTVNRTFDARGNLTFDGVYYKTYDADNKLVKDSSSPFNVHSYTYDAYNRRVSKNTAGVILKYHYSGAQQLETRDAADNVVTKTIFSDFLAPIQMEKNGNKFYYHQNELNSVEALTNNKGRIIETYIYDAYGQHTIYDSLNNLLNTSIAGNRFGFTGQEFDSATNSYKFFFRNYSPSTGTFDQRDPMEYQDAMGLYQYVGNNPANGIDVWGLEKICDECKDKKKTDMQNYMQKYNEMNGHVGNDMSIVSTTMEYLGDKSIGDQKRVKIFSWISNTTQFYTSYQLLKLDADCISQEEFNIRASELLAGGAGMFNDAFGSKFPVLSPVLKGFGYADAISQELTGNSLAKNYAQLDDGSQMLGRQLALNNNKETKRSQERFNRHEELLDYVTKKFGKDQSNWTDEWIDIYEIHSDAKEVGFIYSGEKIKKPCPPEGGTKEPPPTNYDGTNARTGLSVPLDPNEIRGPEGETDKKWVAISKRMGYTVLFENDSTATAPANIIRITAPVHPKHDVTSFELGSFGFNSQSFDIPPHTSSYYARLDCRDSLNLYVDVTAGYDQQAQQAFWEFRSIDPVTLLPNDNPTRGLLLLQDSLNILNGNGFVNYSLKPIGTAHTLDTVSAQAKIIFEQNDAIETNVHTNTIDAVAPVSSITSLQALTPDTEISLHYTGRDDQYGSGVRYYSIYVSDNNGPTELFAENITTADTMFYGLAGHQYRIFAAATDTAGNVEDLRLVDSTVVTKGEEVICPNGSISFDAGTSGSTYQWQVNTGTGFTNVANNGTYSGANGRILNLTNAPTSMSRYQYRCLVNGADVQVRFILKFGMSWLGTVDNKWETAGNWSCATVPDQYTDVIIDGGKTNYPTINANTSVRTLRMNSGASATVKTGILFNTMK